ncbi:hypothetical protein [Novosphingobium lentum]|uniref:hypothetical protein n=1 Tax=Novosphingobium lentum TaxID=145287 RepID=UPI00082E527F|nr:hypothetical protein [Novosphingobium lentum]
MDLDGLMLHYFGTEQPETMAAEAFERGKEALSIAFGTEREPGRRFALWALMEGLGMAPLPAEAFAKHPDLRRAADAYLTASWRLTRD